jgi:hypothetical protein
MHTIVLAWVRAVSTTKKSYVKMLAELVAKKYCLRCAFEELTGGNVAS